MNEQEIIKCCLSRPGAFLDYPFGPDVIIIKVKSTRGPARIFAQFFTLEGENKATFSCDMMNGEFYREQYPSAVRRGYHCPPVQQPYFITVDLDGTVPDGELIGMIAHAYAAVVVKMPQYAQRELREVSPGEA